MKLNWFSVVLLLFVFNLATEFSDAFAQAGGNGSTNSGMPPREIDKQSYFEAIKAKAENGDAAAQFIVGRDFETGMGIERDKVEAVKWYRKAAEQKYARAQFNLGVCYLDGQGVAKDENEAVKWFRKAAEQNLAQAQYNLGQCYFFGNGVTKNNAEAVKWYRKAAEQNFAEAQHNLAVSYQRGEGVIKDAVEAVKWWRKAADQGNAEAQISLGISYAAGEGVTKDETEAVRWYRKAAEQNFAPAQYNLGQCYFSGEGVTKDETEAVKWYRKAAEQNLALAQYNLGRCYYTGEGVAKDYAEAMKWWRKAAEQGCADAQDNLASCYANGDGVPKDFVEAYKWWNLSSVQGSALAKQYLPVLELNMTPEQIAKAQQFAREFKPRTESGSVNSTLSGNPKATGTGFFITDDGYLISNYHVVKDAAKVRLLTGAGLIDAKVVRVDAANDLALLKADGRFAPLPIAASRTVALGGMVATVGFPNIGLQGFAPKLAKGEIASLSGAGDDPRYFQISAPVQPGNSGGALVDERGNVIGIVSAKLDAGAALAASGALPENVNYAVKSSLLLSFLESVPDVDAKLKAPNTKDEKFENVVKSAQAAAVLVLVY